MVNILKKIYHRFSDFKIVKMLGRMYTNGFPLGNYKAYLRLKNIRKKTNTNKKIKVVFLCQYTQVWNKLKSVYEKMVTDDRFDVKILAVPENINNIDEKIYDYFFKLYGDNVINSYINGEWLDLKAMDADYVFYQRPYDQYLPKQYRSDIVSGYSRVCHVVYGYQVATTTEYSCMNKRFFRNVYMYFAENKIYYDMNINRFKKSHKEGVRKTFNVGYPALEDFMKNKTEKENKDNFNVLWTPRWTEDKENGGSNFINFKDKVLELTEEEDISLTFRPHPMTFEHFISVGRITKEEVDKYIKIYEESDKLVYDRGSEYAKTFWESDMLLTDVSTIIVEYFLTGKPIVYCDTGSNPNKLLEEMLKVFYVVRTWEEAKCKVLELSKGIDPLKEERHKKIRELMGDDFEHISERFLDEIYKDYNS